MAGCDHQTSCRLFSSALTLFGVLVVVVSDVGVVNGVGGIDGSGDLTCLVEM